MFLMSTSKSALYEPKHTKNSLQLETKKIHNKQEKNIFLQILTVLYVGLRLSPAGSRRPSAKKTCMQMIPSRKGGGAAAVESFPSRIASRSLAPASCR
jgi:hypothetical protein